MAKKKEKKVSTEIETNIPQENVVLTETPVVENKNITEEFEKEVSKVIEEITEDTNKEISNIKIQEKEILKTIEENPENTKDIVEKANIIKNRILKIMSELRIIVDMVESKTDISYWPVPTYIDLLFSI